jgi:hypothetical protein
MTNGDRMFEELGYQKREDEYEIRYCGDKEISLNKTCKDITIGYLTDYYEPAMPFSMAELKAINKKCEELGWME